MSIAYTVVSRDGRRFSLRSKSESVWRVRDFAWVLVLPKSALRNMHPAGAANPKPRTQWRCSILFHTPRRHNNARVLLLSEQVTSVGEGTKMQQRKNEILAKRAKLAELKRQRELRQRDFQQRLNAGESPEVGSSAMTYSRVLFV